MYTGNEFCKINEAIQHIGEEYGIKIPSARLHRKVITTTAHGSVDDNTMRKLNRHMAYSAATSAMYYQLPS